MSDTKEIDSENMGRKAVSKTTSWVQTEKQVHVEWGKLTMKHPAAAAIVHTLLSMLDKDAQAIVISQPTLAKVLGCHINTVKRSILHLKKNKWIQVVKVGSTGTSNAYVLNSAVAWVKGREDMRFGCFRARVIADADEQDKETLAVTDLRKVPVAYPPEKVLPVGDIDHGEQGQLPGFEPFVEGPPHDPETGEIFDEPEQTDLVDHLNTIAEEKPTRKRRSPRK